MTTEIAPLQVPGIGNVCPQCFSRGHLTSSLGRPCEIFSFGLLNPPVRFDWNVDAARHLITARPRPSRQIDTVWLRDWLETRSAYALEHLEHIPLHLLNEPGIMVELVAERDGKSQPLRILIDGTHRAARSLRKRRPFSAYVLTDGEQRLIRTYHVGSDEQ
jgi:hypothetical protein